MQYRKDRYGNRVGVFIQISTPEIRWRARSMS